MKISMTQAARAALKRKPEFDKHIFELKAAELKMALDKNKINIMAQQIMIAGMSCDYFICNAYDKNCECADCKIARKAAQAALNVLNQNNALSNNR